MRLRGQLRNIDPIEVALFCGIIFVGFVLGIALINMSKSPASSELRILLDRHDVLDIRKWDELTAILKEHEKVFRAQQDQIVELDRRLRNLEEAIVKGFLIEATRGYIIEERALNNENTGISNRDPYYNYGNDVGGAGKVQ
jgi:hypothetical protein